MAASFLGQVAIFEGIDEGRLAALQASGEERSLGGHQVGALPREDGRRRHPQPGGRAAP